MTAIRIVFHVVIGIDRRTIEAAALERVCSDLDERLTRLTGGIIRFVGTGTWIPGSQRNSFNGKIERDIAINYLISVSADREEEILVGLRAAVSEVVLNYRLPVEHVHVARSISEERIFSIEHGHGHGIDTAL